MTKEEIIKLFNWVPDKAYLDECTEEEIEELVDEYLKENNSCSNCKCAEIGCELSEIKDSCSDFIKEK